MPTNRRELGQLATAGIIANMLGLGETSSALADASADVPAAGLAPSILPYLKNLDLGVAEIANTWKPDDPRYRADVYRQIMMNLSYSYFAFFHADPEHPDWSPLWNPVYLQQPNPDTLYLYAPLRGDLTYRISGDRGTCNSLVFSTQHGFSGFVDTIAEMSNIHTFDVKKMQIGPNREFELILSQERPAGYSGNWAKITPDVDTLMVRYVSQDWANEIDPHLAIECLDKVGPKKRLTPEEIIDRIERMALFPARMDRLFFKMQDDLKKRMGVNVFDVFIQPGVDFQYYWPCAFEFSPGEALILETELPERRPYWNVQVNDPYFNCAEYVYRLSSLNDAFAKPSSDGKLHAVVSLDDPGVPNWLDTAGFTEGTLWGRWYDCSSQPRPTLKRVPFVKIRDYLPADTPHMSPDQRDMELRARVRAAQLRRRW
jgi:hypothetical protein